MLALAVVSPYFAFASDVGAVFTPGNDVANLPPQLAAGAAAVGIAGAVFGTAVGMVTDTRRSH